MWFWMVLGALLEAPEPQKAKENLLCGKEEPVSGPMRDGEKGIFPEPYPASKKVASVSEDEGYSLERRMKNRIRKESHHEVFHFFSSAIRW